MYSKLLLTVGSHLCKSRKCGLHNLTIFKNVRTCLQGSKSNRQFSVASTCCNQPQLKPTPRLNLKQIIQEKIKLTENLEINYGHIGHGPKVLLCIPGIFGTIETDFEPIMKKFDHDQFTILSLDFPGYGKSRPPSRQIGENPYEADAEVVELLMKTLEIPKYSIAGWSNGGTIGMHVIANNPSGVEKLIFWGTPAFLDTHWVQLSERMLSSKNWGPKRWDAISQFYDDAEMQRMLQDFHDYVKNAVIDETYQLEQLVAGIHIPTLIVHGIVDRTCTLEHAKLFHSRIQNSLLETFSLAQHAVHLEFSDRFVNRVEKFLLTDL